MAVGLMVFGEDEVSATSDLGVPVRAAAIEPRREDILFEDWAGERVHIATGDEIRTFDLRSRALVAVMDAPGATSVAVDGANGLLIVGSDSGSIATIELDIVGVGGVDTDLAPAPLTELDHPIEHLLVSADGGTVLAASGERLSAVDIATGTVRGVVDLPGIADLAQAGTGAALVGTPSAMGDPEVVADTLAELLDGDRTPTWRSSPGLPTPTRRSCSARQALATHGQHSTRPSRTDGWRAWRSRTCRGSPWRPMPASRSWIPPRPACRRRWAWSAGRTAWSTSRTWVIPSCT